MAQTAIATAESLRKAISSNEIWPAFQPLVDIHSGAIFGFEVLARWSTEDGKAIAPCAFIPIAERSDLINALTSKIVTDACRQAVTWPGSFVLAINISPTQFRDPNLFQFLTTTISATGFPLSRIHVEITESALLEDDETVKSTIQSFKSVGMGLALDDFGTGFASLTCLHGFPFDKLKIDMSFVRSMQHDSGSRKIVASVIGLGQSLGMTVVAEGVETDEQAALLRRFGCDVGQGWLFGRPADGQQTLRLLNSREQQAMPTRAANASLFHRVHQLDVLYSTAPIGFAFLDLDLRHISVNTRFAQMLGLTPDQMVNRTVHDFMPGREARHVTRDLQRVLNGETVTVEDYQPIGHEKEFFVINQRVDDDAGEPIGISVTAIDMTERRRIEAALMETEDHARWSIGLSPNIPWSSDASGVVNFMGPTPDTSKLTTADRIVDWYDRMHPDDRLRVRQEWLEWLPTGNTFETMFRMRLQDETWQWMLSRAKPHVDTGGKILKWFGVITEISAEEEFGAKSPRYRTILEMVERSAVVATGAPQDPAVPSAISFHSKKQFDANQTAPAAQDLPTEHLVSMLMRMFELSPIAMSITTSGARTSTYVKVNEAYLRLTGLKWDDIKGKRLTDEGAAIDNPARDRRHRLLAEEGSYQLEEVDIAHADGTIVPTLISAQRTVIDNISFDVEIILDVSARVRQQREIEHALKASARTDALSGLPNRAAFDEFLAEAVARNLRNDRKLALAFIDLNKFKAVNDTLGHSAGDEVLQTIASRLRESFRATDFIARIGGDEFVVVLDVDRKLAGDLQSQLLKTMERVFKPIPVNGQVTSTGAAVGVTFLQAYDTALSYVERADEYMYIAKATGERVAVVCFGQILDTSMPVPKSKYVPNS
ncbi:EAL domain-containing protein [Rhizobium sp. Leaf341]|uniref:EAL domain-containing protein n=1 Tax=Rhizobium sp. Leaf341 TaxID=1736344 RepID=UPI000ADE46EC|nr:EAL domain-containing protein [Rhizobium sp. Leaf341]